MSLPRIDLPRYTFDLPSTGQEVKFRPFTVKERKILLIALEAKDEQSMVTAVKQIAENCMIEGPLVKDFTTFDLEYFFLQLKARSIGEITKLKYVCKNIIKTEGLGINQECGAPIEIDYNILTTKVITNPDHHKKIPLSNDIGVVMKYPTVSNRSLAANEGDATKLAFEMIADCIDYIWDHEKLFYSKDSTTQERVEWLESLPDEDFKKIEQFFETMPYVQDTLEFDCGKCKYHHTIQLEGLANFFD